MGSVFWFSKGSSISFKQPDSTEFGTRESECAPKTARKLSHQMRSKSDPKVSSVCLQHRSRPISFWKEASGTTPDLKMPWCWGIIPGVGHGGPKWYGILLWTGWEACTDRQSFLVVDQFLHITIMIMWWTKNLSWVEIREYIKWLLWEVDPRDSCSQISSRSMKFRISCSSLNVLKAAFNILKHISSIHAPWRYWDPVFLLYTSA